MPLGEPPPTPPLGPIAYQGGCHCGAVRFEVIVLDHEAVECNCSMCTKKGILHLIVPPERFRLLSGEDSVATYTFGTGVAQHYFCRVCGIHSFYRPRSHPGQYDVNVRCLDDNAMMRFRIVPFDGRHWEDNVGAHLARAP